MLFNSFVFGTQYYRAPTPLTQEWEEDIKKMVDLNISTFQIRVQWRWNEPKEGIYYFNDVDRLIELANKYGRKTIIKFMLETAPQYVFGKLNGTRKNFCGVPIIPASHGAFYVGGWLPCFDNLFVRDAAIRFVERTVDRYKNDNSLILWNAWNEPRSRPSQDCACDHSMLAYRKWLENEFGTIERFNDFFGIKEESFGTISPPGLPEGYWDYYMFRKWRAQVAVPQMVNMVADTIRKLDSKHPIICHVGYSEISQPTSEDVVDDFELTKVVDFIGTSYPVPNLVQNRCDEVMCSLVLDFMRSLDKGYFVHEMYPDWGMWTEPVPVEDLRYKLWTILSRAPNGLCFWQYRAERLGCENNCAGLVHMDGSLNQRSIEVGRFGNVIQSNIDLFNRLSISDSEVAILFDWDSSLISKVEELENNLEIQFKPGANSPLYYYHSINGMYRLFSDSSIPVDFLDTRHMADIGKYKVVYAPCMEIINQKTADILQKYILNGGVLLADEGFGLRQENTWLRKSKKPFENMEKLPQVYWTYRVKREDEVVLPAGKVRTSPFKTLYCPVGGISLASYSDEQTAIIEYMVGSGKIILMGCPVGYSYMKYPDISWKLWMETVFLNLNLVRNPCDDLDNGISSRQLICGDEKMIIVFNRSDTEKTISIPFLENIRMLTEKGTIRINDTNTFAISKRDVKCVIGKSINKPL